MADIQRHNDVVICHPLQSNFRKLFHIAQLVTLCNFINCLLCYKRSKSYPWMSFYEGVKKWPPSKLSLHCMLSYSNTVLCQAEKPLVWNILTYLLSISGPGCIDYICILDPLFVNYIINLFFYLVIFLIPNKCLKFEEYVILNVS